MKKIVSKYPLIVEIITGIIAVIFLIYQLRSMLIFGKTTLAHDNFYWDYPIFQFFAENIINGHFPFWNPFHHAGEPFYPVLGQIRLLEPIGLLVIYFGQFITNDIVMLFNWNRFIQSLIILFGVYIVFRPWAEHIFIRLTLIPILLFSSFMLGSFRQGGILTYFLHAPFTAYFLLRIVYYKDYRWRNWLMLAVIIGLSWQSYLFAATWIFLLFFTLGIMLFYRNLLAELFKSRMIIVKFLATAVIIFAMAMPNIVLMLEKGKYVFPARMADNAFYEGHVPVGGPAVQYEVKQSSSKEIEGLNMPYNFISFTGSFSSIWDFIQLIAPDGNKLIQWPRRHWWGNPSEAYMYLGFLPWAIALLGLVAGRHDLKRLWLFILLAFGLLMLGPPGGLHRLLYYVYPPMWFVRHTHAFVLFFMFAFLYFYVLGFNRLFSTWGGPLFPANYSQGFLPGFNFNKKVIGFKKFIDAIERRKEQCTSELAMGGNEKNALILQGEIKGLEFVTEASNIIRNTEAGYRKNSSVIAILISSACIITFVYLMTKLTYPETNYLFVFIGIIFATGWFLRRALGEDGLYISLIASQIVLVLMFSTNTFKFLKYIFLVLGLPAILFIFINSSKNFSKRLLTYSSIVLLLVFSVALTSDLINSLRKSSFLYQGTKHPAITYGIKTTVHKPFLPPQRFIYPSDVFVPDDKYIGTMRYLSTVYRQPFAFSSIMESDNYLGSYVQSKDIFKGLINGSFESWVTSKKEENESLPEHFRYYQSSKGGGIEKNAESYGVKDGRFSVLLKPSFDGNSFIRYKKFDIDEIIGQYIRVSLWVKSQNVSSDAIQMDVQINSKPPTALSSYANSGDWEKLTMVKYIDKNAEDIAVTCNIKSFATAPAYLDGLTIEIVEVDTNTFAYALNAKRWSSFLLPKNYFKLINMDISPLVLQEMFAVNKPMFQLKQKIVRVKEIEMPVFLKELGSSKAIELLQEAVLVDEQIEPLSAVLTQDAKTEQKTNQTAVEKAKFTYSIENYNHNSFDVKVSADNEGFLYWADGYDKNWHAYIDGMEIPIYRANINFKTIHLPKGTNKINFVYNPFWFKTGLFVFYGIFSICVLTSLIMRIFRVEK